MEEKEVDNDGDDDDDVDDDDDDDDDADDDDDDESGHFKFLSFPEVKALRRSFTRGKLSTSSTSHIHEIVSL